MEIEKFLSQYRKIESEFTRKAYRGYLKHYDSFLKEINVRMEDAQAYHLKQFSEWVKGRPNFKSKTSGVSDTTVQSHLAAVRSFYKWHNNHNNVQRNPAKEFKYYRTEKARRIAPIPPVIIKAMCSGAESKRGIAIVKLFRGAGVRLAELIAMNKDTITIEEGTEESAASSCGVATVVGKGKKERTVLVSEIALDAIADYLDERGEDNETALFISSRGCRISRRTVQREINAIAKNAGAEHAHPHQLRHSFGTEMTTAGLPESDLQKRLGHDYPKTTYGYTLTSEVYARKQYDEAMRKSEAKAS